MRALLLLLPVLAASCNPAPPVAQELPVNRPVLTFDYAKVTELSIACGDPRSGDTWTASFRTDSDGEWSIVSPPGGATLVDRRADSAFIRHLLDTLRTLVPTAPLPKGDLASYGLDRPLFSLRWKTPDGEHEVRIGAPHGAGGEQFTWVDGATIVARGATLRMIEHIDSFDRLRRKTLLTFTSDDVDELELWQGGKKVLYAQRAGIDWQDARKRPLPAAIGERLEALAHLRIRSFIDEPESAGRLYKEVSSRPAWKAVLKDRQGRPTTLSLGRNQGRVVGLVTSRPGAVFELYPGSERLFSNPVRPR